jgi:hypothetical protein
MVLKKKKMLGLIATCFLRNIQYPIVSNYLAILLRLAYNELLWDSVMQNNLRIASKIAWFSSSSSMLTNEPPCRRQAFCAPNQFNYKNFDS